MPCNTCNRGLTTISSIPPALLTCAYTKDIIIGWKNKLACAQENAMLEGIGITTNKYNSFMGTILSGINYEYNICYLEKQLKEIEPYISKITGC